MLRGNGVPLVCSSGAAQLSVYRPPFEEFEVQAVQVQPGSQGVALPVNEGPLVVMVQRGSGRAAAAAAPQQQGEEAAAGLQSKVALQRGVWVDGAVKDWWLGAGKTAAKVPGMRAAASCFHATV